MPEAIAKIIGLGVVEATPQMLVDLALKAHQDRRDALAAGNLARAQELGEERDALLDLAQEN